MTTKISELPDAQNIGIASSGKVLFSSTTSGSGTKDVGLDRYAAGTIHINNGSTGDGVLRVNQIDCASGGTTQFQMEAASGILQVGGNVSLLWFSGANVGAGSQDVGLKRDAAAVLRATDAGSGMGAVLQKYVVEAHTSGDTLLLTESNSTHTNTGAGGSITIVLPAASTLGLEFTFYVGAAQNLVIDAAGTDLIRNGASVSSAGGTATNGTVGSTITLRCVVSGTWAAMATPIGTWTLA